MLGYLSTREEPKFDFRKGRDFSFPHHTHAGPASPPLATYTIGAGIKEPRREFY
jgi:hypothetical protein